MKITRHYLLLFLISHCVLSGTNLHAQEKRQTFPISVSLNNHSWAFPFKKVFRLNPIYPGLAIETEYYYKPKGKFKLYQTAQLGGFINKSSGPGIYLNSNFGMRYTMEFGLTADLSFGLGYFYTAYTSETYVQNADGFYEKSNRAGIGAMSANISLGLGYDLSKKFDKAITPFIRYQWIASTSYWSLITIRPNGLLHIGAQFYPFQ